MNMPGFTAEASLYKTSEQYQLSAGQVNYAGPQVVPALPIGFGGSCSSKDGGMDCYGCSGGCIRTKSVCCCAGTAGCPPTRASMLGAAETSTDMMGSLSNF